eukprot:TRINITY_DN2561_c0_g1_i2.p1 TRINITY_DN2561_c0_g1~~TRINITY_DN2561_c0_g1_i2.p1  ORF type:complete len:320 (-),score=38.79 TRINITY_DN2561_c0_g1_i2:502-1461(-)
MMRVSVVVIVSALLVLTPIVQGVSMSGLSVSGNQIVNKDGQPVILKGVNRSGFEYMCIQGSGQVADGPVDQSSINAMLAWNINSVRIPLNSHCWLGLSNANPEKQNYIQGIQSYVQLLTSNNLAVILDLHWTSPNSPANAEIPMPDAAHSIDFWKGVATAFSNQSNVMFELFNEPFPNFIGSDSFGMQVVTENCDVDHTTQAWECYKNGGTSCVGLSYTAVGTQDLVNAIRSTGANNIIIVNGIHYAECMTQWETYKPSDPLDQIAAGAHMYRLPPWFSGYRVWIFPAFKHTLSLFPRTFQLFSPKSEKWIVNPRSLSH